MLKLSNKHSYVERNADLKETVTFTSYDVTGSVKLAMDSIWDYVGFCSICLQCMDVNTEIRSYE